MVNCSKTQITDSVSWLIAPSFTSRTIEMSNSVSSSENTSPIEFQAQRGISNDSEPTLECTILCPIETCYRHNPLISSKHNVTLFWIIEKSVKSFDLGYSNMNLVSCFLTVSTKMLVQLESIVCVFAQWSFSLPPHVVA